MIESLVLASFVVLVWSICGIELHMKYYNEETAKWKNFLLGFLSGPFMWVGMWFWWYTENKREWEKKADKRVL